MDVASQELALAGANTFLSDRGSTTVTSDGFNKPLRKMYAPAWYITFVGGARLILRLESFTDPGRSEVKSN